MEWRFESRMPGVAWPAVGAPHAAAVLALLQQLEHTQWLPAQRLLELQLRQAESVIRHAASTVPYYRDRLTASRDLGGLPLLGRRDVQDNYAALKSDAVPAEHGKVFETRTSGSTGAPVRVVKTQLSEFFWNALTLRENLWHGRDLHRKLAAVRHGVPQQEAPSWSRATAGVVSTGPAVVLGVDADVDAIIAWLQKHQPAYFLTYPSILEELARACLTRGITFPGLLEVRTVGELLPEETRRLCHDAWGLGIVDMYSAEEVGYIALQCPKHEHYHVQAETVLVEVLDEHGQPCREGETGRIVVTDLHNFAMPLLRYDIGDYAEVGPPCSCGRGLPVLTRIVGRVRNTLVTADGKRYWPTFGQRGFTDIAPVLQHQFVQTSYEVVEARLVTREPLTAEQTVRLSERISSRLPATLRVEVLNVESLPRGPNGKYEDFISLMASS